jgi:hypothetical protein
MAIHDATYPTRPSTLREFRWRLRYLFEERVGRRISEAELDRAAREDAAFERARRILG